MLTKPQKQEIIDRYWARERQIDLAKKFGVSQGTICLIIKEHKSKNPGWQRKSLPHGKKSVTLTEEQMEKALKFYQGGVSLDGLIRLFGLEETSRVPLYQVLRSFKAKKKREAIAAKRRSKWEETEKMVHMYYVENQTMKKIGKQFKLSPQAVSLRIQTRNSKLNL